MKRAIRISLSESELDMVIAALRLSQRQQAWIANTGDIDLWAIASEHGDALTNEEIDSLIERIN